MFMEDHKHCRLGIKQQCGSVVTIFIICAQKELFEHHSALFLEPLWKFNFY